MSGLDDLLAGVAGFSKPSMASLKQQQGQGTPVQASAASFGAQPAAAPPASSGRPPVAAAAQRDPFAAEQLEQVIRTQSSSALAQQRAASASGSAASLSSLGGGGGGKASGGAAFDDLLGGLGAAGSRGASMRQTAAAPAPVAATPAAPAAAPQPAPPGVSLQPVLSGEPLPAHDDDPLAMFGGLPPAAATGAPPAPAPAAVADIDDGLLAAFAAPSPAPAAAPQQQQQQAEAEQGSLSADFGDFKGSEGHEAPAPRHGPAPSGGSLSRPAGGAGPTSGFGYERPASSGSQGGTAGQSRYRVFDYVDSQPADEPSAGAAAAAAAGAGSGPGRAPSRGHLQAAAPARSGPLEDGARRAAAAAAGPGSGVLHAGSYAPQPAGKEVVSELGHKAAKALQSGTKWFARASKALASQVQHRLQQHGGAAGGSGATASGSAAGRPGCAAGGPAPFHFDWAAQLARASPGSRAAALGAMAEDDRLAVQRVLDEATLGDSYMEGPEYDGYAPTSAEAAAAAVAAPQRDASRPASQAGGDMGSRSSSRASLGAGSEARPASAAAAAPLPSYGQLFGGATQEGSAGAAPAAKPAARPAPPPADDDLLGFGGGSGRSGGPAPAPAASAAGEDLLGFGGGSAASSTAHIDDLFTVPAARPAAAAPARGAAPRPASSASASRGSGLDSMIDLGADLPDVDTSGYEELYAGGQDAGAAGDEPEVRRALRQKRLQEKHERMMRQLAETRARDEAEEAEKSGKVELRATLKPKIDAWAAGKKDNIRALLASLHTVLWEDSGWTPPSMADMVEGAKVRRAYMKANLVVHPDKVKQKGGSLERVATADMVFDVLKAAWGRFEAAGSR